MNIFLDTVGCRLNQAEIEQYARQFRAAGHLLVARADQADLVVINTCTVTAAAASDSRQKVRQASRKGAGQIVLTGCWSTLKPDEAVALPGVSRVINNQQKDKLVQEILEIQTELFDQEPLERQPIPGTRTRTRAFIKAQDGCDNRCTFCITTLARGEGRSRPIQEILADIQATNPAQEIVLTGVHLGSWGQDLSPQLPLRHLVEQVLERTGAARLRLSSLEPWDLDEQFFELWGDPRLCRQLHLPLQSGCERTLRRMARKTTPEAFAELVQAARQAIPGVAITTDIITGFPGEDEQEFEESLAFVQEMQFADGHVFTYSARSGTAAARMPGQIPQPTRKQRNARMREVLAESALTYQTSFLGQTLPVLWESAASLGPQGWEFTGLTGNYLRVFAHSQQQLWNQVTPVVLEKLDERGFHGRILGA
ncbi:MAG TPA: tRNA (N(6)-L-threonylcarbamoyladenosine(37)-C(2))-methylthiotransferase MtaB [Anaerolineales bacterium]|nr:tRNA (N(6)-L-threonylcarbamoyladenosine(37)-C(2))-methylthiotransferase MtaB [Anaerolineales bacterium]